VQVSIAFLLRTKSRIIVSMRNYKQFLSLILLLGTLIYGGQQAIAQAFSLGAGDVIRITVYGQPDLATTSRIAETGKINFPLIGDVTIGGLSTAQAERNIAKLLNDRGLVRNAQVSIFLEQRRQTLTNSVTILGQVARPGKYSLQEVSGEGVQTLIDLLAIAGGTNANAADYLIVVKKEGDGHKRIRVDLVALLREGELKYNYSLGGGDVVLVPEMEVFYIYGQVEKPGRYRLEPDMTVMHALSVASGVTDRGSEKGLLLKRRGKGGMKSSGAGLTDKLQAGDVIYVKEGLF